MKTGKEQLLILLPTLLAITAAAVAQDALPTPSAYLGFEVGADRRLAGWDQITSYFKAVAEASPRVVLVELGDSSEGRPIYAACISAEGNLARLPELLAEQRELTYQPANEAEGDRWTGHKLFVLINCSMHSTEIGASQMSMKLLHDLVAGDDPTTLSIRDRLVVILLPSPNPDGIDMVVDWYGQWLGTDYEGASPPLLYQKYAGHDNNRDWYALNLKESRVVAGKLWGEWFPLVVWDAHQMGSRGFRCFIPPFDDPPNPFLHPLVIEGIARAGHAMKAQAIREGFRGVGHGTYFSLWWCGGFRTTPAYKNSIGLLSELAGCRLATPIEVDPEEMKSETWPGPLDKTVANPAPWPGGAWSLRDIIGIEMAIARGLLGNCALHAEQIIADYRRMCLDGMAATDGGPLAYILPRDQHDMTALKSFAELLRKHGVETQQLGKDVSVEGETYPAGTLFVDGHHPFRPFIRSMFERISYPDFPPRFDGTFRDPYDVSGWTVVDQFGLKTTRLDADSLGAIYTGGNLVPYREPASREASTSSGLTILPAGDSESYARVNEILAEGGFVERHYPEEEDWPEGRCFVNYNPNRDARAMDISGEIEEAARNSMRLPRLAIIDGLQGSIDVGWTRLLLDRYKFPYAPLDERRIREGNLGGEYDAIILAGLREKTLLEGRGEDYPPDYRGGIGAEGIDNLKEFLEQGGTIICIDSGCGIALKYFDLPVADALEGVERSDFSIPGSILRLVAHADHTGAFGMEEQTYAMFHNSRAFVIPEGAEGEVEVVAEWAGADLLVSGFARGAEKIAGKPSVVYVRKGEGRAALIGFPCQFRAQPFATFKLLFDAVYCAGDLAKAQGKPGSTIVP